MIFVVQNTLFADCQSKVVSNFGSEVAVFTRKGQGNGEASGVHGRESITILVNIRPRIPGHARIWDSLKHRKPREDHLHVNPGIEVGSIGVRDVLVLVSDRERAAVAVDDLDAAAEIEGEVETRGAVYWNLFVEVEKAAGGLTKWLHASIATEVEFQADRRSTEAIDALSRLSNDESRAGRHHNESRVRKYRDRNRINRPFERNCLTRLEDASVA